MTAHLQYGIILASVINSEVNPVMDLQQGIKFLKKGLKLALS